MADDPQHNPLQGPGAGARRLVLGSASPRRAELLREAGFAFEQRSSPFDEEACDLAGLSVAERVGRLAGGKAEALAEQVAGAVVLTADTLISLNGQAVGKPGDADHARQMLENLLDTTHQVLTGVCVIDCASADGHEAFVDVAEVEIAHPGEAELEDYLASGAWRGKAGGYNLAELDGRWRFRVTGDPTTVVGLPMRRLTPMLARRLG